MPLTLVINFETLAYDGGDVAYYPVPDRMKILLVGHTASGNALGRLYSNWIALRSIGQEPRVLLPEGDLWRPLRNDHDFQESITTRASSAGNWAEVLLCHKPWIGSLDIGLELSGRGGSAVVLDVDDPDFEQIYGTSARQNWLRAVRRRGQVAQSMRQVALRRKASQAALTTISNPSLRQHYGPSIVIPHARLERNCGEAHTDHGSLRVAFIGTPRPHKGLAVLRSALRSVTDSQLTVTAEAPPDARPNESWVGEVDLEKALQLVDSSDVVCIPSLASTSGGGQLPVKLIDAMISGRAIVASDLPPIRWALAGSGILVKPGDQSDLAAALQRMTDRSYRADLGAASRRVALDRYTATRVGNRLGSVLELALD